MRWRVPAIGAALACASVTAPATAQARTDDISALPAPDDRVHVDITPDLWGLSMTAKGSIGGQATAASIPLGTIVKHLDNLFLGEVDVRKGHLAALVDVTHAAITLPGKGPLEGASLPISATFLTLAAGWSSGPLPLGLLGGRPVTVNLEPFAGATYDSLDARIRNPQGTIVARLAPDWWSPMVGTRVDFARGRGSLRLEGYVSGFSDSRSGQQALASYAYRLHWHALRDPTLGGGYRYSRQYRAVDGDNLALKLQGPVVYMTFHL